MSWRLLNVQGIAGLAVSVILLCLLLVQKGETRHWRKQSAQFERLYRAEQSALATTVADYRAAAETARAADRAAAARITADQRVISERTAHDYENRLAAARGAADRLQRQSETAAADPGPGRAAAVPGAGAGARPAVGAAAHDRLSVAERLIATEQAIQLDELIKWVKAQSVLDPNADAMPEPSKR